MDKRSRKIFGVELRIQASIKSRNQQSHKISKILYIISVYKNYIIDVAKSIYKNVIQNCYMYN